MNFRSIINGSVFLGLAASGLAQVSPFTRLPYLQQAAPTEMSIRWRTNSVVQGRVWFGVNPESMSAFGDTAAVGTEQEVRLTGLQPNTRYYFGVGTNAGVEADPTARGSFVTSPLPGRAKRTRFWILGDSGTGGAAQFATRDSYRAFTGNRGTDRILLLGDNAYGSGFDNEYQGNFFDVYASEFRKIPFWPTIGNHETAQSPLPNPDYDYHKNFTIPTAGEAGGVASGTERYYSADHGNVHLVSLDSMTSDRSDTGAMANWLRADLAATSARWIIAYWHHPPYSHGSHNSDFEVELVEMRQVFNPILEQYGVDVVLGGHSHGYERSWLMNGHFSTSDTFDPLTMKRQPGLGIPGSDGAYLKNPAQPANQGTVYVVAGSAAMTSGVSPHPAMPVSLNELGTAVIDVQGDRLEFRFVRETGAVDDRFAIIKPWAPSDSDTDGMPNEFEIAYGLNPNDPADASKDTDGDGVSNVDEFRAKTDPAEPDSVLRPVMVSVSGKGVLRFPSRPGTRHVIEHSLQMNPPIWNAISGTIEGTGNEIEFVDDDPEPGRGFYRVRVVP